MIDLSKIQQLRDKVESLQKKADRASGGRDQIMTELKKEYEVDTLEEAQKLLTKLEKEESRESRELEKELQEFERQFGERLDDC